MRGGDLLLQARREGYGGDPSPDLGRDGGEVVGPGKAGGDALGQVSQDLPESFGRNRVPGRYREVKGFQDGEVGTLAPEPLGPASGIHQRS
jgi:hypothetical protein